MPREERKQSHSQERLLSVWHLQARCPRGMQPKQLLQQFNAGSKDAKNFIIYKKGTYRKSNQQGGLPLYIARRTGRGKNKSIQLLYHFQDSVN